MDWKIIIKKIPKQNKHHFRLKKSSMQHCIFFFCVRNDGGLCGEAAAPL